MNMDSQDKETSTPTKEIGIKGSIFGSEESQKKIEELKGKYPNELVNVIIEFIQLEARDRDDKEPDRDGYDILDAVNVVTPACARLMEMVNDQFPDLPNDLEELKKSFRAPYSNFSSLEQRKTIIGIYLRLREKLCPELPSEGFSLETD